jgi:F1F0 ATPase subunit 2
MNNFFVLSTALIAGFAAGAVFFGGLWFTVRKGVIAKVPALWFIPSFIIRVGATLVIFYYAGDGTWQRLLLCLTGFLIARVAVTRFTKNKQFKPRKEESV